MHRSSFHASWLLVGIAVLSAPAPAHAGDPDPGVPPSVILDEPAEGAVVGSRAVRVTGAVGGPADGRLIVNGVAVAPVGGRFETTVEAPADGALRLRAVFGALGAPAAIAERIVEVDATPPTLTMFGSFERTSQVRRG